MAICSFQSHTVVPPCTIIERELKGGFAIMDKALVEIGKYYTGA